MKSDSQNDSYNQVLESGNKKSSNFWKSDSFLRNILKNRLKSSNFEYLESLANKTGELAATVMDELSLAADQNGPKLRKRNRLGENIDQIDFHPAYWQLMQIAVDSQMMRLKWEPELRAKFHGNRHQMGFALGYLFAMAESGQYCPLCMTDGVAHLLDRFASPEDQARLLPHISTSDPKDFFTGAMFLTEKSGGSDVGANLVAAKKLEGGNFALFGEKWFCSNVNADIIFALARTNPELKGTKGLSLFLVEKQLPSGEKNPLNIVRLKEKLGTRSMASGECLLEGTVGKMVGEEFQGFYVMAEMINLSRMYNSVAALAGGKRALIEAWQFLAYRKTFGKIALDHALVRDKFWELGAMQYASFQLVWRSIAAMDAAELGNEDEASILRLLTPMTKRSSAEIAVYLCRESMELMGGMGYIEESIIPKMMRDVMVLPIWEGAGNIMILDMLRACKKGNGLQLLIAEVENACISGSEMAIHILQKVKTITSEFQSKLNLEQDELEFAAKSFFLELTKQYQYALLLKCAETENDQAAQIALKYFFQSESKQWKQSSPPSRNELDHLIGWEF